MSSLLSIDTSSAVCTVALWHRGSLLTRQLSGARAHGQFLLSAITELVDSQHIQLAQLNALAVVVGPGSFTGIRIGVGAAQGLATALEIPVIPVSSLEWIAWTAFSRYDCSTVVVCTKARDAEYYFACYRKTPGGDVQRSGDEQVGNSGQLVLPDPVQAEDQCVAVGNGWQDIDRFSNELLQRISSVDSELTGSPESLADLARYKLSKEQFVTAERVLPSYLKEDMNYRTSL